MGGMKDNVVRERSYAFALAVIALYRDLVEAREFVLSKQVLRAGTSIGANVEEAQAAQSRAEFAAKAEETKKRLEAELTARLADAERKIDSTKKSAMANVRGIAAEAADEIVKRLTGTSPNKQSIERAVDAALH